MKSNNICKFVTPKTVGSIKTLNFIYESKAAEKETRCYIDRHLICLVISGKGHYRTDLIDVELLPGTVFFGLNGKSYEVENIENLHYMYISFCGSRVDELFKEAGISAAYPVFYGYEYLIPLWQSSISRTNDRNVDLLSESILLYSFSMLSYQKEDIVDNIKKIIDYLDDNFTDYNLSLKSISDEFGYNIKYLSSLFTKKLGVGFSDYLTNLRINYSLLLIEQGVTSVKNIAILSGYSDPLYFSKVFKKSIGISPKSYISRFNKTEKILY